MPRKPSRFVKELNDNELKELKFFIGHGTTVRIRQRAHAILLSHHGKTLNEIADIFSIDRDTVANWLDRWDKLGVKGLADKQRPGPKPKLNEHDRELVLNLWQSYDHSPKQVVVEFERQTNKSISLSTVKRLVATSTRYRPRNPK